MFYIHFYKQLENFHILIESNDKKPFDKKITVNCNNIKFIIIGVHDCIQHSTDGEL